MKSKLVILLLLLPLAFAAGCWNRMEPENLLIILAVAFERDEESGDIRVIVQAVNPGAMGQESPDGNGGGGGGGSPIWVGEALGRTAFEAVKKINIKSTRQRDFTHTNVIFFSEELAREGIADILDFLDRERQLRAIARPLVLEGDLRKAMEADFSLEEVGARAILNHITVTQEELSTTMDIKLRQMFNRLGQPGWEVVLPRIVLVDDENGEPSGENPLEARGLAAFKKDRLVGWLDEQESRGLNWLHNGINRVIYVLKSPPRDDKEVSIEIFEASASLEAAVKGEGIVVTVDIRADGRVQETTTTEQWLAAETELTDSLARRLAQAIRNDVNAVVEKAQQELGTDVLGFGNLLYRTLPKEWEKLAPQWDEIFPEVQVEILVDANVRRTALVKNPLQIR